MKRVHLGLAATSLFISACSGGGGESFGGEDPVSGSFPITSSNGVETTRLSYEAAIASGAFAEVGDIPVAAAPADGFAVAAIAASAEDVILDSISLLPFGPVVDDCLGGSGTITLSGDLESLDTITAGDTYNIVYDMCDDGLGSVIDGSIDITVTDFSGDLNSGAYLLAMDTVVTSLSVTTGPLTVTGDGDASIATDTSQLLIVVTSVSGTRMSQTTNSISQTLSNYASDVTVDSNQQPEEYSMDASGTLDHSSLAGDITYSTPTVFRGYTLSFPYTGSMLVEGENSTARLIVLDENSVRIEVDDNADGVVDHTEDLSWDAFLGNT